MNELPLRKVFVALDGASKGPNLCEGPIGRQLASVTYQPINLQYKHIEIDPSMINKLLNIEDISSDQKYLRDIILLIHSGILPRNFEKRSPGKLGYARWLTTANRIL